MVAFCTPIHSTSRTTLMESGPTNSSSGLGLAAQASVFLNAANLSTKSISIFTQHDYSILDVDLEAGPYLLHTIQPSRTLEPDEALRLTADWS